VAYKILYTDEALVELENLIDYIRTDSPGSAERFGTALLNHVEVLREFPRIGLPVSRRSTVRRILHSPIRVYYRLHDNRKVVEILHFWHASRSRPKGL
jgi:plasmid stabilization system protein ParE